MSKSLSIIIPNYNGEELLKTFMPSVIQAVSHYNGQWEIIIVDDKSPNNNFSILKELEASNTLIKVIYNKINLGFAGTCNVGIKAAKGEILFFLNNDVELKADYFNYFNEHFNDPSIFAVTTKAYRLSDFSFLDGLKSGSWSRGMPRVYKDIDTDQQVKLQRPYFSFAVQGAYFFADAKKVKQIGGFDELLSPYIFEETDLSYRALKRGWKIIYEPSCVSYHAVSATIKKKKKRKTRIIATKNKLIFTWKNIHSTKLLFSHFLFLIIRLLFMNLIYWRAFLIAIKVLDQVKEKRRIEKKETLIKDLVLFKDYNF